MESFTLTVISVIYRDDNTKSVRLVDEQSIFDEVTSIIVDEHSSIKTGDKIDGFVYVIHNLEKPMCSPAGSTITQLRLLCKIVTNVEQLCYVNGWDPETQAIRRIHDLMLNGWKTLD